ncbi:MAG: DUF1465 family protein [Novosphingobium sp.]|uniref:DUF1465 family protein n=1 Tax=Tsuneonella sp. CC-YZS046 TaxID=3042152 RepID=UPI002D786AF2|nr:DUF1465 family protein [Tsuneonella sp. CC-YZS046]WRO65442.1 DUF1465 family protein [Tsuneonella sp. CC-YZS046]
MTGPANINPHIIETLYSEAMVLADNVRDAFDMSGRISRLAEDEDLARIALSCEALRATTRMMHTIAWLLNQRAYFNGELSEFQLRRHGRLPRDKAAIDAENYALLDPALRELIGRTQRFHARIARLDNAWRDGFSAHPGAIHRLRDRLGQAVSRI